MADVSKLKFENGLYDIKDTTARNEINTLDQKIESNTNQLESEIDKKLNTNIFNDYLETKEKEIFEVTTSNFDIDVLQSFIDTNKETTLKFKEGNYVFDKPLILYNNSVIGEDGVILSNDLSNVDIGTEKGILMWGFDIEGNPINRTTVGTITNQTDYTLTFLISPNLNVGDTLVTTSYIGVVTKVDGLIVTVDRKIYHDQSNLNAWKPKDFLNISVSNLEIDFNSKYGFGIKILGGKARINSVVGYNFGSKAIELKESIDSIITNCRFTTAFDKTAGMGYGVRLTYCSNVLVEHIIGTELRHTVDINMSYNCVVRNCEGHSNITAFMTHGSGSVYNLFKDNNCFNSSTGAYGGLDIGGDLYNTIDGGIVEGRFVEVNHVFKKETTIRNIDFIDTALTPLGKVRMVNCRFKHTSKTTAALIRLSTNDTSEIEFVGCSFDLNNSQPLMYTTAGTQFIEFKNCTIETTALSNVQNTHSNNTTSYIGCTILFNNTTGINPKYLSDGTLMFDSCYIKGPITNICGSNETGATLIFKNNTLVDIIKAFRSTKITNYLKLGSNVMINSFYDVFSSWTIETLGVVTSDTITGGTWEDGSTVIQDGSLRVRKSGNWVAL